MQSSNEEMVACVRPSMLACQRASSNRPFSPPVSSELKNSLMTLPSCYSNGVYFATSSVDVERHTRDFMDAAKKLQLFFLDLMHEDQPTNADQRRKEIAMMEEELKTKTEIIKKHERLIQGWKKELKDQLNKHATELEKCSYLSKRNVVSKLSKRS